jgi:hypothetical protein
MIRQAFSARTSTVVGCGPNPASCVKTMHEWKLKVGLRDYSLAVTLEPNSGKYFIRIDGKVAAKPMAPEEVERVVTVGTSDYLLRRNEEGSLDLEFLARITLDEEAATERGALAGRNLLRAAGLVVAVAVAALGYLTIRWGSSIPANWTEHGVAESILTGSFPGMPDESAAWFRIDKSQRHGGRLALRQSDHEYILSWVDYPAARSTAGVWTPIVELVGEVVSPLRAELTREERFSLNGNPAIAFTAVTESREWHSDGASLQGIVSRRAGSLYVAMVIYPKRDHLTLQARRFLRSVRLAEPDGEPILFVNHDSAK